MLEGLLNLRGEEEDEKTHENDQDVAGRFRVFRDGADDGDDKLADRHADSAPDEQRAPTEPLNGVEGDGRRADVDDGGDDGDQERILQADRLEERGVVVLCVCVSAMHAHSRSSLLPLQQVHLQKMKLIPVHCCQN
jgi:hypothetical protein